MKNTVTAVMTQKEKDRSLITLSISALEIIAEIEKEHREEISHVEN
jgi:hypothetical protein